MPQGDPGPGREREAKIRGESGKAGLNCGTIDCCSGNAIAVPLKSFGRLLPAS